MATTERELRIVQLSDLHLTPRDGDSRSEPDLFGALTGMNAVFRQLLRAPEVRAVDLLLVTGDVTDRGDAASWRFFWRELERASLAERVLVIPGNHDVCSLGVRLASERERRAADLARLQAGLAHGGQDARFPRAHLLAGGQVAVFALDSSNAGNATVLTNAVGTLGQRQLERLARLLRAHRDVPVKLVALHHSPNIPHGRVELARGLTQTSLIKRWGHELPEADRRALRLLCLAHGVQVVVHGHLHRAEDRRVGGVRIVGAEASTQPTRQGGRVVARLWTYAVREGGKRVAVRGIEVGV